MLLADHSVVIVAHCVTKMITRSSIIVQFFFDDMIVASSDRLVIMTHQNVTAGIIFGGFYIP